MDFDGILAHKTKTSIEKPTQAEKLEFVVRTLDYSCNPPKMNESYRGADMNKAYDSFEKSVKGSGKTNVGITIAQGKNVRMLERYPCEINQKMKPRECKMVRVPIRNELGYFVGVEEILVDWSCPECGEMMGIPKPTRFCEDGEYYIVDTWSSPCGHEKVEYKNLKRFFSSSKKKGFELSGIHY